MHTINPLYTALNLSAFAFLIWSSSFSVCVAQNPEQPIQIVTEQWYPYNYLDPEGNIVGSSTERIKAVFNHAGIPYLLNLYPWVRAYQMAMETPNVVIYSIFRSPERENKFQWICPLGEPIVQYFYKLKSRTDIVATNLQEIKKYKMGVNRMARAHQLLLTEGLVEGKDFSTSADTSHYFTLLINDRVDVLIDTESGMLQKLEKVNLPPDHTVKLFVLYSDEICMATSLSTPESLVTKLRYSLSKTQAENH